MKKKVLIVVDMQEDFFSGSLGTKEAQAIVPRVAEKAAHFDGTVIFTLDTHGADYLKTQEGRILPVPHCIKGTAGHRLVPELENLAERLGAEKVEKEAFGSLALADVYKRQDRILFQTPVYSEFYDITEHTGRTVAETQMTRTETGWTVDLEDFEKKAKDAKVFLFCNPHNPFCLLYTS